MCACFEGRAVKFSKYEVQQVLTFVILRERSEEESGRAPP